MYANSSIQAGGANSGLKDNTFHWQGNIYRTHQLGLIQAYYGAGLTLGNYQVAKLDSVPRLAAGLGVTQVNSTAGNKFYGSGNIHGGINLCIPFGRISNSGEFRFGVKSSLHQEFGNYLSFRKALNPDSLSGLVTNNVLGSFAFTSELVFSLDRRGRKLGLGGEFGCLVGKDYRDNNFGKGDIYYNNLKSRYTYISGIIQLTFGNLWTAYVQQTFGTRVVAFHAGVNYRLFAKRKKPL
ncbi:hypothetical protein FLA_5301 [Filimonas lacunae]|nr:hypothetical protein FLA_5301 [Filimonas lacunae]